MSRGSLAVGVIALATSAVMAGFDRTCWSESAAEIAYFTLVVALVVSMLGVIPRLWSLCGHVWRVLLGGRE